MLDTPKSSGWVGPIGRARLIGKSTVVFGAGAAGDGWGNGRAAAALYAREGARVLCVDIDMDAASYTRDLILAEGGEAECVKADVTSESEVEHTIQGVLSRWGRIDILHNNVGITHMGELEDTDLKTWQRVVDVNLTGAFLACRAVIPAMVAQGGGAIVNISSLASIQINDYPYASYNSSKAGLNHLTRALACRYAADGIRVNAVLPGVIHTPLIDTQISGQYASRDEMIAARNAKSPMGRMGTPWEVASVAIFLASDEASYVTGACIPVDGGKNCIGR